MPTAALRPFFVIQVVIAIVQKQAAVDHSRQEDDAASCVTTGY